jgi:hypothetical protein
MFGILTKEEDFTKVSSLDDNTITVKTSTKDDGIFTIYNPDECKNSITIGSPVGMFRLIGPYIKSQIPDPKDCKPGDVICTTDTQEIFCLFDNAWVPIEGSNDKEEKETESIILDQCEACGARSYKMLSKYRYQCEYCDSIKTITWNNI